MSGKDKSKKEPKPSNDDWAPVRREERDLSEGREMVDLKKRSK